MGFHYARRDTTSLQKKTQAQSKGKKTLSTLQLSKTFEGGNKILRFLCTISSMLCTILIWR